MKYIYLVCGIGCVCSFLFKQSILFGVFLFGGLIAFATSQVVQIVQLVKQRKNAKLVDRGIIQE